MPASIGVNLRVTGHSRQGGRKYMEDFFSVAYQQTEDERDLEYAFAGIYDGHGGAEAAAFAKEHLMSTIIKHKSFWSDNDEDVLRAIKDGYNATHLAMWAEQAKWPKTASGLPSTAGTTASVAFIRRGKIYIGHVGDSGIILGYQEEGSQEWSAKPLTRDHKPENVEEMTRITQCGGKVAWKSGVPRVVWNRPKIGHQGPLRRSTPIDEIPFLAVARSLGDLWSYNSKLDAFIVSPEPDCSVHIIDPAVHRCLIFGTDGLYNMLTAQCAVRLVQQAERHNENATLDNTNDHSWINPSKLLVEKALERWHDTKMRADNTSVVTLMLDPPGPPRAQVLKNRRKPTYPERGLQIVERYEQIDEDEEQQTLEKTHEATMASTSRAEVPESATSVTSTELLPLKERNYAAKPRDSTSFDPREVVEDKENILTSTSTSGTSTSAMTAVKDSSSIQINEISSSSSELDMDGDSRRMLRSQSALKKSQTLILDEGMSKLRKSSRIDLRKMRVTLAQRILKTKKMTLKRKIVKKKIMRKRGVKKIVPTMVAKRTPKRGVNAKSPPKSMPKRSGRRLPPRK